jgi:general secretion pathway protein L
MARTTTSRRRQRQRRTDELRRFFRWWGRELAAVVPPGLRPPRRPPADMLWACMESGALALWRLSGQKRNELGRVNLAEGEAADHKIAFDAIHNRAGRSPVGVCLPSAQVLRREITLPLAAAENLPQVIGFELARQTPFSADQAYYDQRVLREDRTANRLHVLLGAASRAVVDQTLSRLAEWGVTPHAIVVSDELEGSGDCLDLLPPPLRPKPARGRYWLYAGMAAVSLGLLAASLLIPLWQKREVVIALQPILDQAQSQAEAVDALRQEQERMLAEYNFPLEHKLATPPKVALLEEVTRVLPDNTWLQQLEIHGTELSMQGNTSSSAKLVGLFEQSGLLESASFKSPLVKVQGSEERFQLTAGVRVIDFVDALAALRDLHDNKRPAEESGKAVTRGTKP